MAAVTDKEPWFTDHVTKVALHISCENLPDVEMFSKCDPLCVLHMNSSGPHWCEIGRTEKIKNCLNPKFSKTFVISYYFKMVQKLRFEVYDIDKEDQSLQDADLLGELECTLGEIVSSRKLTRPLVMTDKRPAGKGTITICAEERTDNRVVEFKVAGRNLDRKTYFSKSDPFLEFYKQTETGWQLVHRTEVVRNTLNPVWRPFRIPMQSLCGGDMERATIKVDCYDYNSSGSHDHIGLFETTLSEMLQASQAYEAKKNRMKGIQNSCMIIIKHCEIVKEYSFLDYIMGGCQIHMTGLTQLNSKVSLAEKAAVRRTKFHKGRYFPITHPSHSKIGIDFTGSNGDPSSPKSLHYINPEGCNEYQAAIQAVGNVIQDYGSDKMFPAFGFGALIPPSGQVSHKFPINFNPSNPSCAGIEGVLHAYQQCLHKVRLYGPTNFSPIINHVAHFGRQAMQQETASQYFILLIITDGLSTDMDETRKAIVSASHLPISIIFVELGRADFSDVEFLYGVDGVVRTAAGEAAMRDILQFLPFRQFQNCPHEVLAQNILAKVPAQVASFFNTMGLRSPCSDTPPPDLSAICPEDNIQHPACNDV